MRVAHSQPKLTAEERGLYRHISMLQHTADRLYDAFSADTSRFALRPHDASLLRTACMGLSTALHDAHAASTVQADCSAWRCWLEFCAVFNTEPLRTVDWSESALTRHREQMTLALFLIWTYRRMKPRQTL